METTNNGISQQPSCVGTLYDRLQATLGFEEYAELSVIIELRYSVVIIRRYMYIFKYVFHRKCVPLMFCWNIFTYNSVSFKIGFITWCIRVVSKTIFWDILPPYYHYKVGLWRNWHVLSLNEIFENFMFEKGGASSSSTFSKWKLTQRWISSQ